ncbi:MAG TPA: hypothetical protein VFJ74_02985 [Gemmatimonadaceae bacterium]|nr:hypothetical protein [Gemmatimonadaceae bacterium]
MSDNLPAPLDRAALERVLARATELQAAGAAGGEREAGDDPGMSEQQLLEIAREVGLSESHVRQALAEERTRVALPEEHEGGWLARVAGPGVASATRTVRGTPQGALAALDVWMQRQECLVVKRRFGDRIVWEARRDIVGNIKRGFNLGGRGYHLARADDVAATAIAVDDARVLVRLDARLTGSRASRVRGGVALVGAGTVAAATMSVFLIPAFVLLAAAPVAAAVGGGAGLLRQHAHLAERVQLALEQALDRLEHEGAAARLTSASSAAALIADVIGSAVRRAR